MAFFDLPRARELAPTYLLDWVISIIFLGAAMALEFFTPFHRRFSIDDKTISFPFTESETINNWQGLVIAYPIPLVIITLLAVFVIRSGYDWHQATLGLTLSFSLAIGLTQIFKSAVGRLRPDFLARCIIPTGTKDPEYGLLEIAKVCQQTSTYILNDGSKSFPSGHSSSAFAGMTFLALYMAGKLQLFDRKGYSHKLYIVLTPLAVAGLVAVSRVDDYRHHWQDVLVGSLLGASVAYFVYRQYYPALYEQDCSRPYSPRKPKRKNTASVEEDVESAVGV
jgi:diacylglycerol diphosphate phosphatase/phosphatidate phosphatase